MLRVVYPRAQRRAQHDNSARKSLHINYRRETYNIIAQAFKA